MKYIYLIIAIVIVVGVAAYFMFLKQKVAPLDTAGQQPAATEQALIPVSSSEVPAGDKIALGTSDGIIYVNNFYKIARGYSGEALVIKSASQYLLLYDAAVSAFGIYIVAGPVQSYLNVAENDLIGILGVQQAQACLLDVSWSVSSAVDKNLSGRNYPLSFCPPAL